uniref:Uncharacterized protein n=1 Tax=Brassica oleracea var. oleracea TaxID=109376 RepID=A0A0D3BSI0_BRAOL
MVDGVLASVVKETFEIPSQAELINRAFAGDDVLDEFDKVKEEVLNQEVPKPEKPVLLPAWGDWIYIQRKRGIPGMVMEYESRERERGREVSKQGKTLVLNKLSYPRKLIKRSTEKLYTTTLQFPHKSKELFEHSMRMPTSRVLKKTGVIIKPVRFEEVNPNYEVGDDEHRQNHQKQRPKKKTSRRQSKVKSK